VGSLGLHIQRGSACTDLYWLNKDCHHTATKIWSVQFISSVTAWLFLWAVGSECLLCFCWMMVRCGDEKYVSWW